ncbi:hypothetical protein [Salibacter halophilus]|uniref:Uncharacterized protein n=1 Tax=Salibacter halophilus TaxID=1803916 RepID=A0A6N6M620_9FLAO|nr:hypothetical protein [Salibacter halophilus]KAB1063378.1 hypothetical protein F3059_09930 [Salibacter halophilus]
MFLVVPFVYLFLCGVVAIFINNSKSLSVWTIFLLSILVTPFVMFVAVPFLPARPKAYCTKKYKCFEVGKSYPYKIKSNRVTVYYDKRYIFPVKVFNDYFSIVTSSQISSK